MTWPTPNDPQNSDGIAGYEAFQRLAQTITADDFADLQNLSDGGVFAARLDGETEAQLRPFDTVRAAVEAAWTADQKRTALRAYAQSLVPQINGGADMPSLGLTVQIEEDMLRSTFVENAPPALVLRAFELAPGQAGLVEDTDGFILVRVDAIHPADMDSDESQALTNFVSLRLRSGLQTEVFSAFAQAVQAATDVQIDTGVVQSVNSQVRGSGG